MLNKTLLLLGLLSSLPLLAEESENQYTPEKPPFTAEVELGYQSHTGNTDSQALNSGISAEYTTGRHRYTGDISLYKLDKDGEEDKYQVTLLAQNDYKLGKDTYLYGSFKGVDARHSAYFKDYTLSGGLGYQLSHSESLLIELELGPGYRYQEPNLDELDEEDIIFPDTVQEPIVRGHLGFNWQLLESLSIMGKATYVAGDSNTRIDTELSLTNDITEHIALKIITSRESHDKVPEGLSKADSMLSVNLLFLF